MAKTTSEIVAENMEKQKQIDELVEILQQHEEENADLYAQSAAKTQAVLDGTSDKLVKETEAVTVQPEPEPVPSVPAPVVSGVVGFVLGVLLTVLFFKFKLKHSQKTDATEVRIKKPPVSPISVLSPLISICSFLMFISLLNGSAVLTDWFAVLWCISGFASVVYPICAKAIRAKEASRGKVFEIIALILGFFNFYLALMYTTRLDGTFIVVLVLIPCIMYAKLLNPKTE